MNGPAPGSRRPAPGPADFEVIRDPLWNNIRVDAEALALLDSEPLQRLRYVRQLGHAFLVYPGATHSRFEHALGAYHLARRALTLLRERGELDAVDPDEPTLVRLAALLHDVGHYPFSHALEEAGLPSHEALAAALIDRAEIARLLDDTGIPHARRRVVDLITGRSESPLEGLISGSLDLDKIEYLTRDARMCGVPYGTVDVDRLLHSITLAVIREHRLTIAVHEKGVTALESLLFAKYQMYRNVYWHHAVRSATAMFKRLVRDVISRGEVTVDWIAGSTDEALMERLHQLPDTPLAGQLRHRRLYKRTLDVPAADLSPGAGAWIAADPDLVERVEDALAAELGLRAGEILLDFPAKPQMLAVDLPVLQRGGDVGRLNNGDGSGVLGIQRVAAELHTGARRFRIFAARPVALDPGAARSIAERGPHEISNDLARGSLLLSAMT